MGITQSTKAVLVAIAIPIFNAQLEKSRESTDIANIRDAYAEIAVGLIDGSLVADGDTMTISGGLVATYSITDATTSDVTVAAFPIKQTQAQWQSGTPDVAGYTLTTCPTAGAQDRTMTVKFTFTTTENNASTGSSNTYLSAINFGAEEAIS